MIITQKQIDDRSLQVSIAVGQEDYAEKLKKALNDYRRKAEIKGFRKGMVPMGIVQKLYGRTALLEEVNTVVSDALNNYIKENNISIIAEPLPSEEQDNSNDFENGESFVFNFDLMLSPEFDLKLDNYHVPYYKVAVTEEEQQEYINNILRQYGELKDIDSIEEEDFVKVDLSQEDGIQVKDSYITLKTVPQEYHSLFIGKSIGDSVDVDITKICPNETDRASLLKMKKEELPGIATDFHITIKEAKRFAPATEGQDLYDKMFGEGVVTTHEAFMEEVGKRMDSEFKQESDYRLIRDVRDSLIETLNIQLPEKMIKRWLFEGNEGKFTMEQIDKDYPLFVKDFSWQLVCQKVMKEQNIQIVKEDVLANARRMAAYQLAMYGMNNVPDQQLDKYAESILSNEKESRRIYEEVEQEKVMDYLRTQIVLDETSISLTELRAKNQTQE